MIFAVLDPSPLTVCINCSFFYFLSNNSYAHDEQGVNPWQGRGFDGVLYKLWPLLMHWLAASRCQSRWRKSQSRQMWLSPLARRWRSVSLVARRWRSAGQGWHWISNSRPRLEGVRFEIPDKLLTPTVPPSTLRNAHIHRTHLPISLLTLGLRIGPI